MVALATPTVGRSGTPSGVRGMRALSRGRGSDARATICDRSAVGELLKASYAYDPFKGVKTSSTWKQNVSGNWSTERSESYSYAQDIEWLATVTSGGSSRTWDYDAAGNRIRDTAAAGAWTYDALNRMTASPNLTYTNDILGNRLTKSGGTTSYTWDLVNRMTSFTANGATKTYKYRADGMRMQKWASSTSYTDYFYDGQMPIEERITAGGSRERRPGYDLRPLRGRGAAEGQLRLRSVQGRQDVLHLEAKRGRQLVDRALGELFLRAPGFLVFRMGLSLLGLGKPGA